MNYRELWNNPAVKVATVILGVALLGLGVWSALDASGNSPEWLPAFPGTVASDAVSDDATSSPDGTPDKAVTTVTPVANGDKTETGSKTEDPAKEPSTPGGGTTDEEPVTPPATPGVTMDLRILLWNDTDAKAPKNLEVAVGSVKWVLADNSVPSVTGELAALAVGKKLSLEVYPDGRSGKKIVVPILLSKDMRSGSEADAVHVEIKDDRVRVLGTPVENFDTSVERF